MAVGCESDDDPFAPDKNEVYGYEFDCGLAQHVDNQEQTIVVNESTVEGVPEEDSEWNMVRISAYVGPNGSKKYVSYDYNESTETYHYDWCSFSVERIDRKHRQLKVHVAENHTGDSRAIIVEFRKNSNSSAKKYKGEFSIIQGNSDAAEWESRKRGRSPNEWIIRKLHIGFIQWKNVWFPFDLFIHFGFA